MDKILYLLIEKEFSVKAIVKKGFNAHIVKNVSSLLFKSEYKRRQAPPGVKLSIKAFGKEEDIRLQINSIIRWQVQTVPKKIIFQNPCIILNAVQLPENVGMVMRAMLNFGFKNLRLVNPKVKLNDKKIISSSAGAYNIICDNIKIFNSLEESIEDIKYLCATSVRKRDLDSFVGNPRSTIEKISKDILNSHSIGFLFGPEKSGLKNR